MLYEMVSGKKPFEGKLSDLLHLIRHHDAKPLRKVHSSTPRDIETICSRCLRRELDRRFATAGDLADELERFERGEPIVSRRISVFTRTWLWAKRNRAVASLLTAVVVISLLGATISTFFAFTAIYEQNERARVSRDLLTTARSSSLEKILEDLENVAALNFVGKLSRRSMRESISQDLANTKQDEHKKHRRLTIALLHLGKDDEKHRENLFDTIRNDLLSADGLELVSFCNAFSASEKLELIRQLWAVSDDTKSKTEQRFRAQCALAQLDATSSKWPEVADDMVGYLTAMNLVEVQQWLPTIKPIRDEIKPKLQKRFNDDRLLDDEIAETAAAILSDLFADVPEYIVNELLPTADPRQLAHLMTALAAKEPRSKIEKLLSKRLGDMVPLAETTQEWVTEKANLIVALIQLEYPDEKVWRVQLKSGNNIDNSIDNSVGTEVIERLGPASTSAQLLFDMIVAEWTATKSGSVNDPGVLAVELLALGQFNNSQIPQTERKREFVPLLLDIFKNHGDARVHSSARWLMTKWGFQDEMWAAEASIPRTQEPDDGKNWHVDLSGNTFVVFDVSDFKMGEYWEKKSTNKNWENWPSEGKPHRFGICIHEVTFGAFRPFATERFEKTQNNRYARLEYRTGDAALPVYLVDFYIALEFCQWLSENHNLDTSLKVNIDQLFDIYSKNEELGRTGFKLEEEGYRLPTVAEWEYACRAWTSTERSFGISANRVGQYAWYRPNSEYKHHRVAQKKPNEVGLFDLFGNVSEWCLEKPGDFREFRGGSYERELSDLQSSKQYNIPSKQAYKYLGFRLARTYPPVIESETTPSQENEK